VITDHGGQVPVPFRILFDSTQVDPRVTYTLRARIEDRDGRLLWINTQAYPVITQGNPTHDIEIVVTPVG
jgi:putative lipoprotein